MAKVRSITVECAFTKSLPNYQNVKPTAGITMDLEDGDDLEGVYKEAWKIVGAQINEQLSLFDKKGTTKRGL